MNKTLENELKNYRPVLRLARLLPRPTQKRLRFIFAVLFASALGTVLLLQNNILPTHIISTTQAIALCFIFGALWLEQICLYTYYNWYYFHGLDSTIGQKGKFKAGITYDGAETFYLHPDDVTKSFLLSVSGQAVLERLEITPSEIAEFLNSERAKITVSSITLIPSETTSLTKIIQQVYQLDRKWQATLSKNNISEELFIATVEFVEELALNKKRTQRWWSRDALSHTIGLGSELAYGNIPFVENFSEPILNSTIFSEHAGVTPYATHYANKVVNVLAGDSASNVLILGAEGVGKMDIIYTASHLLTYGRGLHALHGHHVVVVDTEHLFTLEGTDNSLEEQVIHFFEEALEAQNITIVIPSLYNFILMGEERGLGIVDILDKYLTHPQLHIIGIDTPESSHRLSQNYKAILRRFESILIEPTNLVDTLNLLKASTKSLETTHRKIISYPALLQVAKSADRYLTDGVMPDRAITLLENIFDFASKPLITRITVANYISEITGLEIDSISSSEREQLLDLEHILASHVISQTQAVKKVANALKRARIDTSRQNKPTGSFLFLGPTGVGKTALAEALAFSYDKGDGAVVRFDMSEYSQVSALERFIGSKKSAGLLTEKLHDHPYQVILFDEFEKAHSSIHDLFLQILNEGYFTNFAGERIDTRNTIIIATSNAGSPLISQLANSPVLTEEITRHLIDTQLYRPELLNRFDEMIIFKPLPIEASRYIVQKNLVALADRLQHDGYTLQLDESVVEILLEKSFSPEFGTRSLNSVVKDLVESEVARQIILQDIKPGGVVSIKSEMT